ncbi:Flp pilus assembly protein CpaB [Roseomonas sp. USHLN139]|uniref:Flp pilus assembly protein CpaB n=1 Tax=Roseomonas sp. USHLN139 TaxID=3081298 RepID=UPI003B019CA9
MLRALLGLIAALALACLGGLAWLALRPEPAAPPILVEAPAAPPPVLAAVIAAGRPLRAGALLGPDDLSRLELPAASLPAGARPDTPAERAELIGAMLRQSMAAGQPLRAGEDVIRPGDRGFLAAVLAPGMRAVSIGVDAVTGTAGLIWPGDRVDLLLSQALDAQSLPATRRVAGETVLADLRVVAIDQRLVQGAVSLDNAAGVERGNRTVTLEVTPAQAERVAVAGRLGRLALTVRAALPEPPGAAPRLPLTWSGDVSAALQDPGNQTGPMLRLFQGPAKTEEIRF